MMYFFIGLKRGLQNPDIMISKLGYLLRDLESTPNQGLRA
jgi:hypothetical protein